MKRMYLIIAAFVIGLALGGWLVRRRTIRTAVAVPPVSALSALPSASRPMDGWQAGIKADTRTDYAPDPAATKRLLEKLRQEESRQRPQERRN